MVLASRVMVVYVIYASALGSQVAGQVFWIFDQLRHLSRVQPERSTYQSGEFLQKDIRAAGFGFEVVG